MGDSPMNPELKKRQLKLQSFSSSEEIAAFLEKEGIKGRQGEGAIAARDCAMAVYLRQADDTGRCGWSAFVFKDEKTGEPVGSAGELSRACLDFACDWDDGKYPNLVERKG